MILGKIPRLSITDLHLKSQALVLLADLQLAAIQQKSKMETMQLSLDLCRQAHDCVLTQVCLRTLSVCFSSSK